jgi:hypothetical protein
MEQQPAKKSEKNFTASSSSPLKKPRLEIDLELVQSSQQDLSSTRHLKTTSPESMTSSIMLNSVRRLTNENKAKEYEDYAQNKKGAYLSDACDFKLNY